MNKVIKICAVICAALSSIAYAAPTGPYAGVGLGLGALDTPDSYLFSTTGSTSGTTSHDRGGFSGRLFGGYNINKYFGLEAGYANYTHSVYKGTFNNNSSSIKYSLYAFSLVGKGYLPFDDSGFNAYALGGVAEVASTENYQNGGVPFVPGVSAPANGSHMQHKMRPTYGLGISYDFSQHVTTSMEVSRIQGIGNLKTNSNGIPNADMMTLNLAYNFN